MHTGMQLFLLFLFSKGGKRLIRDRFFLIFWKVVVVVGGGGLVEFNE